MQCTVAAVLQTKLIVEHATARGAPPQQGGSSPYRLLGWAFALGSGAAALLPALAACSAN